MKKKIKKIIKTVIPSKKRQVLMRQINFILSGCKKIQSNVPLFIIENKYHTSCGYYDLNPVHNNKILYIESDKKYETTHIKLLDLVDGNTAEIGEGQVVNWQQGNRFRWIEDNRFIFNSFDNEKYVSIEHRNNVIKIHPYPIYDVNEDIGISLDFNRLGYLRPGYGYTKFPYSDISDTDNAISIYDINTDKKILSISYSEIIKVLHNADIEINNIQDCYINHISISPKKDKFLFFFIEKRSKCHICYLMVWNKNKIIILDKELSASHYTWKDNNIIMATMYDSKRNCRYFFYNTETLEKNIVMEDLLVKDGHPTFVSENLFVTDTYPDKAGFQKILLVDTQKKEVKTVLSIYSSSKHMGVERCDLHPRYDFENNSVYFDADIDGRRRIYGFNLGDVK